MGGQFSFTMDRNQQDQKTKQFPDIEEPEYQQEEEQRKPASAPKLDPYPAEERDLDEEAHRQLEEGR